MRRAFTIIELLTTIGIVGVLVAMTFPAVQSIRESSRRTVCLNQMKQLAIAVHNFESAHRHLPPTLSDQLLHWQAQCLPFLDQAPMYQHIRNGLATSHPYDSPFFSKTIPILQCSSNPDKGLVIEANVTGAIFAYTDYCGVAGSEEISDDGVSLAAASHDHLLLSGTHDLIDRRPTSGCSGGLVHVPRLGRTSA